MFPEIIKIVEIFLISNPSYDFSSINSCWELLLQKRTEDLIFFFFGNITIDALIIIG